MATSATYAFNPSLSSLTAFALGRCGIRRSSIEVQHITDAAMAANLVLQSWGNDQPNLWEVVLTSVALTVGQQVVVCPAETVLVTDAYLTLNANGVSTNRIILQIGRSEFAAYPTPLTQAQPTVFWFDRVLPPTISLYPTPNAVMTLNYYRVRQIQDAAFASGTALDLPGRFLMAFVDGLSAELALIYAPGVAGVLAAKAGASKMAADMQDRENVSLFITPGISGYYR